MEVMDQLLGGPGGALSWDGAGKINPRALSQLSKGYRLKGSMNILCPIFSGKSTPLCLGRRISALSLVKVEGLT